MPKYNEPFFSNLIEEVSQLTRQYKIPKEKKILSRIKEGNLTKALLLACKECQPGNEGLFRLITTLCGYREVLQINIDKTDSSGISPIGYAALNNNFDLYYFLSHLGADSMTPSTSKFIPALTFLKNVSTTKETIASLYKKEFLQEYEALNQAFSDSKVLPDRKLFHDDVANSAFDLPRIDYIVRVIDFLRKYADLKARFLALPANLKPSHYSIIHVEHDDRCRVLLEKMCVTIQNLSSELRKKHSKCFGPAPFTWITFDQFGGLVKEPPVNLVNCLPVVDLYEREIGNENLYSRNPILLTAKFFLDEYKDRQLIIEQALAHIIDEDLPQLRELFIAISVDIQNPRNNPPKPVNLARIKAITGYIYDMDNFVKLLNLVNYTQKIKPELNPFIQDKIVGEHFSSREELYKKRFNLSTKMGRHAALRLLQSIGELITGKNFSHFLATLDNTIDWRAFIAVRDGITHQDEGDKKYKIDQLLSDIPRLEKIVGEELSYFWSKLVNLLTLREKNLGRYDRRPRRLWLDILRMEMDSKEEEDEISDANDDIERRVTKEEEELFIEALVETKTDASVIKTCHGILDGTGAKPNKKEMGDLMRHLPSRAENKDRYKKLAEIMTKASAKTTTTEAERNQKRIQEQTAREMREAQKRARLKGLDSIRLLAESLHLNPDLQHVLNPLKRVEAAIEALMNIVSFLEDEKYLTNQQSFKTLSEWDKFHSQHNGLPLATRLEDNSELNDAIEYNAGQLLQHLDKIREYPEAARCVCILGQYSDLRNFRNYLEHGDPLFDHQGYKPEQIFVCPDLRQQLTAPMIIKLIYEVLPELFEIRNNIQMNRGQGRDNQPLPVQPSIASPGYRDNGFFSADLKNEDDAVPTPAEGLFNS